MIAFALAHPWLFTFLGSVVVANGCQLIKVLVRGWPPELEGDE